MADNKLNIIYTAENIQAYFEGKLSPEAMHAMEKAALDDPFLAEAMEGFEGMKSQPWQEQSAMAKAAVAGKENTQKAIPLVVPFKWRKAAAAVLVIGAGAGLVYFFEHSTAINKENTAVIAAKNNTTERSDTTYIAVAPPVATTDTASRVVVIKDGHPPLTAQVKPRQTPAAKPITEAENQAADAESMANLSQDKKQISDSLLVAPAPVAVAPGRNNLSKARTEEYNSNSVPGNKSTVANKMPALNNRFSVTVTGADNSPLPFANVLVVDDNIGTYADAKGKFKLVAADSILTVRVKAAGYVPQEYTIKSGLADNRIVLAEQQVATNEMVRLKNKKAAGAVPKITVQLDSLTNVEPEDGWYNYDTYLSNNLSPVIDKNIHGEVEVIFDVQKDGSLSNVSIAKSLCAACDQEALRVIKEGPQWKVKKGKKDKGKVKVKF